MSQLNKGFIQGGSIDSINEEANRGKLTSFAENEHSSLYGNFSVDNFEQKYPKLKTDQYVSFDENC